MQLKNPLPEKIIIGPKEYANPRVRAALNLMGEIAVREAERKKKVAAQASNQPIQAG